MKVTIEDECFGVEKQTAENPKDHRFDVITDNPNDSPKPTDETALATTTTDQSPYSITIDGFGSITLPPRMIFELAFYAIVGQLVTRLILKLFSLIKQLYKIHCGCEDTDYDPESDETSSDDSFGSIPSVEVFGVENESREFLADHPLSNGPVTRSKLRKYEAVQTQTNEPERTQRNDEMITPPRFNPCTAVVPLKMKKFREGEVVCTLTGYTKDGVKKRLKAKVAEEELIKIASLVGKYGHFEIEGQAASTRFEERKGIFYESFTLKTNRKRSLSEENTIQPTKRLMIDETVNAQLGRQYEDTDSDATDIET
uniref:Uncharacterized protein n=1 Tax=Oikopleura dioica TaxID=34765 RepID=Q66S29_OIKDI|nr:hypothetical protein 008-26 [Oikopleura dioica]